MSRTPPIFRETENTESPYLFNKRNMHTGSDSLLNLKQAKKSFTMESSDPLAMHSSKLRSNTSIDNLSNDGSIDDDDTEIVRVNPVRPSLRWKDAGFQTQTMEALNQMRKNRHFCDVTLQIGQQDIPAHRVVLAAASPYLMELFAREDVGFRPSRKEVFELDGGIFYEMNGGFQKEALERVVDYAYTAQLDVPGDEVKAVYMASLRLRMDRVTKECARFLLSQLDLASCLDLRSMPGVAPELFAIRDVDNQEESYNVVNGKNGTTLDSLADENGKDSGQKEIRYRKKSDLLSKVDEFIETNLEQLGETRQLRALPRICLEILHLTKEERDAAQHPRPLCELALDWARNQWHDDETLTVERLARKRHLLYMASDGSNTLKDCRTIEQGSANDSDLVEDYRKLTNSNQYGSPLITAFKKRPRKTANADRYSAVNSVLQGNTTLIESTDNRPSKPRELLYSRHINQDDHAKQADANESGWKVIACRRLGAVGEEVPGEPQPTKQGILAVVSIDRHLATFSIVQRVNQPSTPPTMPNSTSTNDLAKSAASSENGDVNITIVNGTHHPYFSNKSPREGSIEGDLVYDSVSPMSQAKCGVGAECYKDKLVICGGYDRGECLTSVEMYDAITNTWSSMEPMITKRGRFGLAKVYKEGAEILYAVAGSSGQMEENSVERFGKDGKWTHVADLPVAMSNIGVCSLDNRVYCIGGTYGPSGTKYCFRLNEMDSKWDRIANLHQGRFQAAVASYQGQIWVVGGCDAWNPLRTVEVYDTTKNTWTMGPSLSTPRRGCGLAVRKGQLVVVGGSDGTHSLCTTEIFDARENVWKAGPTMTTCRANVAVAVVDDRLWAVGGFSGKVFLNTVEYLDAASDEWTTFVSVPEESISSSYFSAVDGHMGGMNNEIQQQTSTTEKLDGKTTNNLANLNVIEGGNSVFFEMDSVPVEHESNDIKIIENGECKIAPRQTIRRKTPPNAPAHATPPTRDETAVQNVERGPQKVICTLIDNNIPPSKSPSNDLPTNTGGAAEDLCTHAGSDGTEV